MPRRSDRTGTLVAGRLGFAVLVIALIAEAVGFGWRSSQLRHSGPVSVAAATSPSSVAPPTTTATDVSPQTVAATSTTESTTTVAAGSLTAPVSAPGSVTYTVASGTTVEVTATGKCWMQARPDAGGPVSLETTLAPGQSETFTAPVWIRFGNPTLIRATTGTTSLQLPAQAPGDLILRT